MNVHNKSRQRRTSRPYKTSPAMANVVLVGVTTNQTNITTEGEERNALGGVFVSLFGVGGTGNSAKQQQQEEVQLWELLLGFFGLLSVFVAFLVIRSRRHHNSNQHHTNQKHQKSQNYHHSYIGKDGLPKGGKQVVMVDAGKSLFSLRRKRETWTTPRTTSQQNNTSNNNKATNSEEDDLQEQRRQEQPWLRDKRLYHQEKQRQSTNPFDYRKKSTNPFDSSSESSRSGGGGGGGGGGRPSTSLQGARGASSSPGGAPIGTTNFVSPRPRPLFPKHNITTHISPAKTSSNPFDELSSSGASGITPNSTNPFSYSTASEDNNDGGRGHGHRRGAQGTGHEPRRKNEHSSVPVVSPVSLLSTQPSKGKMVDKSQSWHPHQLETIDGMDSLEEFLDTTDETESTEEQRQQQQQQQCPPQRKNQQPHQSPEWPSYQQRGRLPSDSHSFDTTPSNGAKKAAQSLVQSFHQPWNIRHTREQPSSPTPELQPSSSTEASDRLEYDYNDDDENGMDTATNAAGGEAQKFEFSLALHDLCDEARTTDDIAWRNALFLLSTEPHLASLREPQCGMLPLHVCCLAHAAPPVWITRGFLHTHPHAASLPDTGGRLPLHLVAATTADTKTMQLLVEEYPAAVSHTDDHGFTPLHLLLKNDQIAITLEHIRIVLGQTLSLPAERPLRKLQRRGDNLTMTLEEMQDLQQKTRGHERSGQPEHQRFFDAYPDDVRKCLNRLTQWKRKQIRNGRERQPLSPFSSSSQDYANPGSIATPTGKLLPLHLLVRRGVTAAEKKLPGTLCDLVRALIGKYPEALVIQDTRGRTPLMTALLMKDALPSEEMVELLLGLRTPGYQGVPSWAHDIQAFHASGRWTNPAMVPTTDTHQLPLHVAAEEALSNYSLLASVYEAYPAARLVQDIRGRTPLHLALGNYQKLSLDERVFELLYSSDIARAKDDDGFIPLDLVVRHRYSLQQPPNSAAKSTKQSSIYQEFFHESTDLPQNWQESKYVLKMLSGLPPWLRRHACAAGFVQDLLIDELASPFSMASILLNGCVLVALITIFRLAVFNFNNEEMEQTQTTNTEWYTTAIYILSGYHLAGQVLFWFWSLSQSEFCHLCLASFWRWVDLIAPVLAILTVSMMSRGIGEEKVVELAVAATGFLWLCAVGYMVQWSHGMALFAGTISILLRLLIWPCILLGVLVVAFAQMFFTEPQTDCSFGGEGTTICSLRDSFRMIYLLLLGQPATDVESADALSTLVVFLVAVFTILAILLLLGVVVMALSEATNFDRNQIALEYYWEPKLATVLKSGGLCCSNDNLQDQKVGTVGTPSCLLQYDLMLGNGWDILVSAIFGGDDGKETHWYACCHKPAATIPLQILAVFVLPIWILLGAITLGIVWPPQLRRWLMRPNEGRLLRKRSLAREEDSARKISGLRSELLNLKHMSYEQTNDVQQEIRELKSIILLATQGKNR